MNIPFELLYKISVDTDFQTKICFGCTCKNIYKYMKESRKKTVKLENIKELTNMNNLNILINLDELDALENILNNIINKKSNTKIIFNRYFRNSKVTFINGLIKSMKIVYRGTTDNLHSPMIDKIINLTKLSQYSEKLTVKLYYDIDDYHILDYFDIGIIEGKKFLENYSENKKIILSKINYNIYSICLDKFNLPVFIYDKLKKISISKQNQEEYDFRFLPNLETVCFIDNSAIKLNLSEKVNQIDLQHISILSQLFSRDKIVEWTGNKLITNFDDHIVHFSYTELDPNNLDISEYINLKSILVFSHIPLNKNFYIPENISYGMLFLTKSGHKFIINHTMTYITYYKNSVLINKDPIVEECHAECPEPIKIIIR